MEAIWLGGKKMKRRNILIWMCILVLVFSASVSAEEIELPQMDYLEINSCAVLDGNVSLYFLESDNNNRSDEDITIIADFNNATNRTTVCFSSQNISTYIDYTFVNDTKAYYYLDTNFAGRIYVVKVDYSSVVIPDPPWQDLVNQFNEVNNTMVNLTQQVSNLTANNTELNNLVSTYSSQLSALQTNYAALVVSYETYKADTRVLIEGYYSLINETINKSFTISRLETDVFNLEQEINNLEKTFEEVTNTWSTGYTKDGVSFFYFNSAWFIIGGFVFLLIAFVLFSFRKGIFPFNAIPFLKRREAEIEELPEITEKDRKAAIYEDIPEVEKTVLTPIESRNVDDEIIAKSRLPVGESERPQPQSKQVESARKKGTWWDTPEGIAKRQELKDRMREINKRREEA